MRWLVPGARPLPRAAIEAIENAEALAVSAISCWEVVYLHKRARIDLAVSVDRWLDMALGGSAVTCLPITGAVAAAAGALTDIHRDPADRLIIATALVNGVALLTLDTDIHAYPEIQHLLP